MHAATSWGCNDDTDGNSLCQIQVCGKFSPAGVSSSYHEELYGSDIIIQGVSLGGWGHATFMVECGLMSKLSVCVAHDQTTFPKDKTCFVKKQCGGAQRIGLRSLYVSGWRHFNKWEDESE